MIVLCAHHWADGSRRIGSCESIKSVVLRRKRSRNNLGWIPRYSHTSRYDITTVSTTVTTVSDLPELINSMIE